MKFKTHLAAAAIAALTASSASAATMVAYYTFDNASNIGENTGTATTEWNSFAVTQNVDAKFGSASGDFPNAAWDADFGTDTGVQLDDFSISMHVKGGDSAWKDYVSIGTTNNVVHVLEQTGAGGLANYNINNVGGDGGTAGVYNGIDITDSQWHHIGLTVTGGNATIYVDGVARATGAYTGSGTATVFQIGSRFGDGARAITAQIDDVSVWSGALSDAQMLALSSNAASTVPEPSSTALLGLGGLALILRRRK